MSRQSSYDLHNGNRSLPDHPIDTAEVIAFGEFLRTAREQRGITLEQICRETKIPRRHLEALEHGQLAVVPGGTYRRGEIVAYAKVVGLDRTVALHRLERASETFNRPTPVTQSRDRDDIRTRPLVLVVLLAATAFVSYLTWNRNTPSAPGAQGVASLASQPATPGRGETASPQATKSGVDALRQPASTETPAPKTSIGDARESLAIAAPAEAPSSDNRVEIVSNPPGARVTVDGIGWGNTPLTIRNLPPGLKQIRLTKPGYEAATTTARLMDGRPTRISIALQSLSSQQR